MATGVPTRPVLRYPGGKWLLAPWIITHFPPHRCYVEPFAGAASVLMQKPRAYAEILNDLHGDIVALFRILRDADQAAELERLVCLTPYARAEYEDAYIESDVPIERARRLLVRSWQGFNGEGTLGFKNGWRSNSDRRGTLPAHDWADYPAHIAQFTQRLQGVLLDQQDALDLLPRHDSPQTLFYVDPPYDEAVCPNFNGYRHQIDPTALRVALAQLHGMVVVSGYHSPTYDTLYGDWRCMERRALSGAGKSGSRKRTEVLWLNPACEQALPQRSLF
jgi:DNA adenine methylase